MEQQRQQQNIWGFTKPRSSWITRHNSRVLMLQSHTNSWWALIARNWPFLWNEIQKWS